MADQRKIRLISDGPLGRDTRVLFVTGEGGDEHEVALERCITGVDISINVGEPNTATIRAIWIAPDVEAEVGDVILQVIPPRAIPALIDRLRQQLADGLDSGTVEVTTLPDGWRRYLPAEAPVQ